MFAFNFILMRYPGQRPAGLSDSGPAASVLASTALVESVLVESGLPSYLSISRASVLPASDLWAYLARQTLCALILGRAWRSPGNVTGYIRPYLRP